MCGIAGVFETEATMGAAQRREVIQRMCRVIEHRGPDDEGFHIDGGLAIGMRRLSIIDLGMGHQPISNEDGTIWIVFNGEIYNFQELRKDLISRGHIFQTQTDTEVIVHLYEDQGERCVEQLRGMFAFAIWDSRQQKLFLARDRVGIKPLHYAIAGSTLIFGSEIKSILEHPAIRREVNHEAISDYLSFGYIPDPASAFRGIAKLPAGHTATFKDGSLNISPYWDFTYLESGPQPVRDENYYVSKLRDLIAEAVKLRLISDVPLGAFLSGGIDSSTVVAMMARQMDRPVTTFSIGFSESSFDELQHARITARHFNTDHHEFIVTPNICRIVEDIVWHHDEPFGDVSSIPTYIVSKMAREHVTVVLSGDGGDELFAGYDRYLIDRKREKFERVPRFIRRNLMMKASRALPRSAYGKNFLRNIALDGNARYIDSLSCFSDDAKRDLLSPRFRRVLDNRDSSLSFKQILDSTWGGRLERLLYLDSKTYLPGDILTKVDRMTMAHSIEARVPLLDHKLIEFVQTIPAELKLRSGTTKHILKRAMRGLIPDEIIDRPKQGFGVPVNKWFNHELRDMLHDTLSDSKTRQRGYFSQRGIEVLLEEHRRGRRDNSRHLWTLLTLELWHRAYIDGDRAVSLGRSARPASSILARARE